MKVVTDVYHSNSIIEIPGSLPSVVTSLCKRMQQLSVNSFRSVPRVWGGVEKTHHISGSYPTIPQGGVGDSILPEALQEHISILFTAGSHESSYQG